MQILLVTLTVNIYNNSPPHLTLGSTGMYTYLPLKNPAFRELGPSLSLDKEKTIYKYTDVFKMIQYTGFGKYGTMAQGVIREACQCQNTLVLSQCPDAGPPKDPHFLSFLPSGKGFLKRATSPQGRPIHEADGGSHLSQQKPRGRDHCQRSGCGSFR